MDALPDDVRALGGSRLALRGTLGSAGLRHGGPAGGLALAGGELFSGGADRLIRIHDAATGALGYAIAWAPDRLSFEATPPERLLELGQRPLRFTAADVG